MSRRGSDLSGLVRHQDRVHLLATFPRIALHLSKLSIPHPTKRTTVDLHAPLPRDMRELATQLGAVISEDVRFSEKEMVHRERVVIGDGHAAKRGEAYIAALEIANAEADEQEVLE